jgi:hypothetical protein
MAGCNTPACSIRPITALDGGPDLSNQSTAMKTETVIAIQTAIYSAIVLTGFFALCLLCGGEL